MYLLPNEITRRFFFFFIINYVLNKCPSYTLIKLVIISSTINNILYFMTNCSDIMHNIVTATESYLGLRTIIIIYIYIYTKKKVNELNIIIPHTIARVLRNTAVAQRYYISAMPREPTGRVRTFNNNIIII